MDWFFQVVSVSAFMICLSIVSIKNIAIALVSTYAMAWKQYMHFKKRQSNLVPKAWIW